jgi:hypothetical protein
MKFPVADATEPYALVDIPLWPDWAEPFVTEVIKTIPAAGGYGPEDKELAANLVRFALMSIDLLEFAYSAEEKREVFRHLNGSLGERLEWLYTALIIALKAESELFDEAGRNRIIGAFLAVCTLTHDVIPTPWVLS